MIFKPGLLVSILILPLYIAVIPFSTYGLLATIRSHFVRPANSYKPGFYWYFVAGNMNAQSMASVILNGKDMDVVWTTPWRIDVTAGGDQEIIA
jgi:hypothetical protein